jgi:hypothetical protein
MNVMPLAIEAFVVGIVLALGMVMTSFVHWPSTRLGLFAWGLVLGVLVHVGFELAGGNLWYCSHGFACRK